MKILAPSAFVAVLCLGIIQSVEAQNVGIGPVMPDYRLHISDAGSSILKLNNTNSLATDVRADLFFKTGAYYTGAIKTIGTGTNVARLSLFTYATPNPDGLFERLSILDDGKVGIGTTMPGYLLDVNGRMRLRHGGGGLTAGCYYMNAANNDDRAFVGLLNDNYVGLYGDNGGGWGLVMGVTTGAVGIGTTTPGAGFHVFGDADEYTTLAKIENTYDGAGAVGLEVEATDHNSAEGIIGKGYIIGIEGLAQIEGNGNRFGLYGVASNHIGADNYGVYGHAYFGTGTNIGVYGKGEPAGTNWGGYFVGNVYCSTGMYLGSDRKLKNDIKPLSNAMELISQLKPSVYTFKTEEYKQMQLPEGIRYGLIADEVIEVVPGAVKKTIQPAEYENHDVINGKKLSDAVEFNSINYTEMIPILIGAVQEQQMIIAEQQKKIDELVKRLTALEEKK